MCTCRQERIYAWISLSAMTTFQHFWWRLKWSIFFPLCGNISFIISTSCYRACANRNTQNQWTNTSVWWWWCGDGKIPHFSSMSVNSSCELWVQSDSVLMRQWNAFKIAVKIEIKPHKHWDWVRSIAYKERKAKSERGTRDIYWSCLEDNKLCLFRCRRACFFFCFCL